ncbi:hypothetical protein [Nodosilinea sp. E11]|uniref:hypothetical protein n=1 Tax=Nodosilinea sp. E11 TaxID=3037479 RepID=UPI002934B5A3|nr:hypothetical protein [Nodosilinea sp. E11]WOD39177.1 hypothetical protein RRF56_23500 [Nodosilinea sp. E11]
MTPQDPNFPEEIPPVPPPRRYDPADGEAGLEPVDRSSASTPEENNPTYLASQEPGFSRDRGQSLRGDHRDARAAEANAAAADPALTQGRPLTPEPEVWTDSDLQAPEVPQPPPSGPGETVYTSRSQPPSTAAMSAQSPRSIAPAEDVWADTDLPYQPKELGVVDQLLLLLAEAATVWKQGLRWVRSQLPADLQRKLSDEILTAIALGLLMLVLALWNPLGAGRGESTMTSEPQPSATAPPSDWLAEPGATLSGETEAPEASEPATIAEPTPEQSLIADIQTRVSRISRSYGAGLIQSVEVNLPKNTLDINLAETWYGLLSTQQDDVAQDIYTQAQGLQFGTLQLRDPEGIVVARNPVVGANMIILRRLRWP